MIHTLRNETELLSNDVLSNNVQACTSFDSMYFLAICTIIDHAVEHRS